MATTVFSTGSTDPTFDAPYRDTDEWRDEPVRHRYVHGGFEGTDARFSVYLPAAERYEGRFFQPLMAVPGTEHGAVSGQVGGMFNSMEFAIASGGYLVESNQGRLDPFPGPDWTVVYRTSAAVAKYSRVIAADMYGEHRPYGYVFGGSGGAYKTMSCFENAYGVWDGALPYVHPTPMSMPNVFTSQNHSMRILRDKFPAIVDAIDPGGSGDMYAGLNAEEREALAEVTRMGFPPRAWFDVERIARNYHGVWSMLVDNLIRWDPQYFEDFWTVPGYFGAHPTDSLARARVQHKATVRDLVMPDEAAALGLPVPRLLKVGARADAAVAIRVDGLPDASLEGAMLTLTSGTASGRVLYVVDVQDDILITGFGPYDSEGLRGVSSGDELLIDNSVYLASQTYHHHQVDPDYPQFDQFCAAGQPVYPQRPAVLGPRFARYGAGSVQTGRFAGKMIVIQNLMDEAAYPMHADYYRRLVKAALGSRLDDSYRLWFIDHAMHTNLDLQPGDMRPARTTRFVNFVGVLQQGLRDLAYWVEKEVAPPPSTPYEMIDCQVFVPSTATARKGIQPVVTLAANGKVRADVAVGEPVEFQGTAEVPPGAGTIVAAAWDFEGTGDYPLHDPQFGAEGGALSRVKVTASYVFNQPGTYFPVLRITSQRQGDPGTPFGRVDNLSRVRVVVQ
jgi:hypothetical protein